MCWHCDIDVDVDHLVEPNQGKEVDSSLIHAVAAIQFQEVLEQLLVLSELAFPSQIQTAEGVSATAASGGYSIAPKESLFALRYHETENPWPTLRDITLAQAVHWITQTSFLHNAIPVTRVERALAAYTQVISLTQSRAGEVLFRSMQGLEAFYCDGTGDLRKQLAEKSAIWLGSWRDKSNIVGKLYDLRSKFIHGAGPIEYSTHHLDSWQEDTRTMKNFAESVEFSTRILLATLQRCIAENIFDVKWQYSVTVSKEPTAS